MVVLALSISKVIILLITSIVINKIWKTVEDFRRKPELKPVPVRAHISKQSPRRRSNKR